MTVRTNICQKAGLTPLLLTTFVSENHLPGVRLKMPSQKR